MKVARALAACCLVAITALLLTPLPASANPGLTVDALGGTGTATPEDLALALAGEGVTIVPESVNYEGVDNASGTFTSDPATIIGFDSGVLLTSGNVTNVVGPNNSDSATVNNSQPGDPDLDALSGFDTLDASVLEFDFTTDQDQVFFSYVFASEEYNEFVGSSFNDSFGFFINDVNCATVDEAPVTINTINGGNPFGTTDPEAGVPASHPELYRNNDPNDPGPPTIDTQMDGLTTVLTCSAAVSTTEPNHIKLAIADASDESLDSAVFLEEGSFSTTPPEEGEADLSVDKSDTPDAGDTSFGPDPVGSGDIVVYKVAVSNAGPDAATGVTVTDTPDNGTVLVAQSGGTGWTCSAGEGNSVECDLAGSLASGGTDDNLRIWVQAPETAANDTINDTATVGGNEDDPDLEDNSDTEETTVIGSESADAQDQDATFCTGDETSTDPCMAATRRDPTSNFWSMIIAPEGYEGLLAINEEPPSAFPGFCGGRDCQAQVQVSTLGEFDGDENNYFVIQWFYTKDTKQKSKLFVQGDDETEASVVPNCLERDVADPPKCVNRKIVLPNGDRMFEMLWQNGGDPIGGKWR